MALSVLLAVLLAAVLHAGWNALVNVRLDPFLAMTLIAGACGVIALPVLLLTGPPGAAAWPWLVASAFIHLGYYTLLAEAYRRADMSQAYPIVRGSAPLMTTLASLVLLRDPISAGAAAGVATLACGVLTVSVRGHRARAARGGAAVAFALATGATICAYTIVDGSGARASGDPIAYAGALFALSACPMLALCLWRYGVAGARPALAFAGRGLAGGAMAFAAYGVSLWAMTRAPIALVAATRETSVLFGVLFAALFLKEPLTPTRSVAAALILIGLALMRLA